jgi:putative ABC transport system permease protein
MLGIVFGVASVIAMLAVGEGASHAAQEQIRQQGSQNIIIHSVKPPENEEGSGGRTAMIEYGITHKDIDRIRATLSTVEVIVPSRVMRKKVWNVGNRLDCEVMGTTTRYPEVNNRAIETGRFFGEAEMERRANICVLDAEIVPTLFPLEAAVGKSVRVGSDFYNVVGILSPKSGVAGSITTTGDANTGRIYIPLTTAHARFGEITVRQSSGSQEIERVEFHEVTVAVTRIEDVIPTWRVIEDMMDRYHKKQDYEITVPLDLLRAAEKTARIFNLVLGAIAAISLLVGGIGIMNIMLASVTERTREIGIRRALGARRADIVLQFLVEAVILSGIGGIIGVTVGVLIPLLISAFSSEMTTIVTFWSPILAFSISAGIGVAFGLYPALRAADMDPVIALRHE